MHTIKYRKIVELSHPLDERIIGWPGDKSPKKPFTKNSLSNYQNGGFYFNALHLSEHVSTHIDAPIHASGERFSIDQIPLENFIINGCVINVTQQVKKNPDYQLQIEDILFWERINGKIKGNSFIIMRTDWSEYWNQPEKYVNMDSNGVMHFPGFSKEATEFLIQEKRISGIGVETLSIDPGNSKDFLTHKVLSKANKFAIENLTNIKALPEKNFTIIAIPLKIVGGSGSPVTVLGLF